MRPLGGRAQDAALSTPCWLLGFPPATSALLLLLPLPFHRFPLWEPKGFREPNPSLGAEFQ